MGDDVVKAAAEMRLLFGQEAYVQAAARAAEARLAEDEEAEEFWRAVALQLKAEGGA